MSQQDYKVADIALAAWGRKEINICLLYTSPSPRDS